MAEKLEVLMWCAALATWLTLLIGLVAEGLKRLPESVHRRIRNAFKLGAN